MRRPPPVGRTFAMRLRLARPGARLLYRDDKAALAMGNCSDWCPKRIASDWRTSSTRYPLFTCRWSSRCHIRALPSQSGILRPVTISSTHERALIGHSGAYQTQ